MRAAWFFGDDIRLESGVTTPASCEWMDNDEFMMAANLF
jgi:hypothetical protein